MWYKVRERIGGLNKSLITDFEKSEITDERIFFNLLNIPKEKQVFWKGALEFAGLTNYEDLVKKVREYLRSNQNNVERVRFFIFKDIQNESEKKFLPDQAFECTDYILNLVLTLLGK